MYLLHKGIVLTHFVLQFLNSSQVVHTTAVIAFPVIGQDIIQHLHAPISFIYTEINITIKQMHTSLEEEKPITIHR